MSKIERRATDSGGLRLNSISAGWSAERLSKDDKVTLLSRFLIPAIVGSGLVTASGILRVGLGWL
jgi:hypothetical protein